MLLAYADTPQGKYVLEEKKSNSVDDRKRSAFVLYSAEYPSIKENNLYDTIVAMKWYRTAHLAYSVQKDDKGCWAYQFQTVPGTQSLFMELNGDIQKIWIDGKPIEKSKLKRMGAKQWTLPLDAYYTPGISTITLVAKPDRGKIGPAFFAEPVKMQCRGGRMQVGNWTQYGALKFYSGGIRYTKKVVLSHKESDDRVWLDLGSVNATCEVKVNGKPVDVLMHSPYRVDVSGLLKEGENEIEVMVYSTLSNHYQTIPSAYRGQPVSGLLGPVKLQVY